MNPQNTGIGAKGPAKTSAKMSPGKIARGALERIEALEGQTFQLMLGVQQGFQSVQQDMSAHSEFIEAIVGLVGKEAVESKMKENRVARATANMEAMKAKLEKAVEDGAMVAATTIGADSLVVGTQFNAAGEVIPPGRLQIAFSEFDEEKAALFAGKGVDTMVVLPDGSSFAITGIFDPVPQKTEEVAAETSAQ